MAEIKVRDRFVRIAPRKLRAVSAVVRGLPVGKALAELQLMIRPGGKIVRKAVLAAQAAASQQGLTANQLYINQIMVDEGPRLRRFISKSRGRSQRIDKQMSHLTVRISDEPLKMASSQAYNAEITVKAKSATKPEKTGKPIESTAEPIKVEKASAIQPSEA